MRSQHPGISQPRPRQQQGFNDMQLWQQQILYKQMQEIHRQKQLQQLDIGGRQQDSLSQLSDVARQAGIGQSTPVLSGMPINEASMWSNKLMGGESKTASSSHMFLSGNMQQRGGPPTHGISNGLMFPHDQGQTMRSMGFAPQHVDQSLYGTPVSSTGHSLNHYPQSQEMSHDSTDVMNKAGDNGVEKASMQPSAFNYFQSDLCAVPEDGRLQDDNSVDKHGFQGKSLFGNDPVQVLHGRAMSGNFQQMDHFSRNVQVQEFHGGQDRDNWSGKLLEDEVAQAGPSRGVANRDQTEEKLLFGPGNDGNWNDSFGEDNNTSTGGHLHGYPMRSNDHFNAVPSIQSGSWSALMLDALEASSSDTGLQEEWSGLSYQKAEPSTGNHSAVLSDNGKQQTWDDNNNLQSASSLTFRSFPLFNDADASPSRHTIPSFQQISTKFAYEHNERVPTDASHESSDHSSKETYKKQLDQSRQQKQFVGGSYQPQTPFDDVSNSVWKGQMYGQLSTRHSADMKSNLPNTQQVWDHQQEMPIHNVSNPLGDKSNGWNINESRTASGDNTLKIPDNEDTKWHAGRDGIKRTMHMERHHDGSMWKVGANQVAISFPNSAGGLESAKSDVGSPKMCNEDSYMGNFAAIMNSNAMKLNKEINHQLSHQHHLDYRNHIAVGSLNYNRDENIARYQNKHSRDPQARDSTMYITDKSGGPAETFDHKQERRHPRDVPSEDYISNHSHPSPHTDSEGGAREDSLLAGKDSSALVSSSNKSSSQSGRKISGPRRFQYHPMGNLENDAEPVGSQNHTLYSRGPYQVVVQGSKNQEHGYIGQSQFASYAVSQSAVDLGKGDLADLQNAKGAEEMQSRDIIHSHDSAVSSFDGSTAHMPQNKSIGRTSHTMLELLHKVNQSKSGNTVAQINFSDHNAPSEIPEAAASDGSAHSSALQDFGLKLAPPSQRQPALDHDLRSQASLQTANDFDSRNIDSGARSKDSPWSSSSTSVPSLPLAHEVSQNENLNNKSTIYGQTSNQASYSGIKGNSLAVTASTLPHARNQFALLQQQQQRQPSSSSTGSALMDQYTNPSFGSQVDVDAHVKQASRARQMHESHDGPISDHSARASLPSVASRIPPFRLYPSADTATSVASQFHSSKTGFSQPINASLRSSGQQLPVVKTKPVDQPSITSGMSQTGGFSSMLHNIWTNVSAKQRRPVTQVQKIISNLPQSTTPLPSSLDTNSWAPQNADDQDNRKGRTGPSEFGTCSINSQEFIRGGEYPVEGNSSQDIHPESVYDARKTGGASQVQESVPKHPSAGSSVVSIPSLVRLHQQELSRGKHAHDSSLDSQREHVPVPNVASINREIGAYGDTLKSSFIQKHNYSLLQQVQAMKGADSDPSKRLGKRFKGAGSGADAPHMDPGAGHRFIYGQNAVFKELDATSHHSSFPSDVKMLSFSSRDNEEESADASSMLVGREKPSEDHDLHSHTNSLSKISTLTFARGNEQPQINSQMPPSWFGQFGNYKNGQIIPTYDGLGDSQRTAKATAQHYVFAQVSESMDNNIVVEQRDDASQVGSLWQSTPSTAVAANEYSFSTRCMPSDVTDSNLVLIPKKRKSPTSDLLPWHKEVTQGSRRLQNISMAELDWVHAVNRLIEKVEDGFEMMEDGSSFSRSRRRLILTTQLMQQLLPSVPATFLTADATTSYESVTYFVSKLELGDACSLISCSGSDSLVHSDSGNRIFEKLKTSEKVRDHFLVKTTEGFIGRSKKLESDLLRLERRASILDVRLECHDLDRCSIINRFAKFHGRVQTDVADGSSTSGTAPHRIFPQRHITAVAASGNLPDGVLCLSL